MNKLNITILSPHLDDALLDCCDHILKWKKAGHRISVITFFTKFPDSFICSEAKRYIRESGFVNTTTFEHKRKLEDIKAMQKLKVTWKHLDFTDGWFRSYRQNPLYKDSELFQDKIVFPDQLLLTKIKRHLNHYRNYDYICIPLGIGGHIDHKLIRLASESLFKPNRIIYYVDYPYAKDRHNWKIKHITKLLCRFPSIKNISEDKKMILRNYRSQLKILFPVDSKDIAYHEILLFPRLRLNIRI